MRHISDCQIRQDVNDIQLNVNVNILIIFFFISLSKVSKWISLISLISPATLSPLQTSLLSLNQSVKYNQMIKC